MRTLSKKSIETLKNNVEALAFMVQEVNSYDGSLEDLEINEFDDEFFSNYFSENPAEAARAVFFGDIQSWMDDYIRFNGYGNLESISEYEREKELKESADEIVQEYQRLVKEGNVDPQFLLDEYE